MCFLSGPKIGAHAPEPVRIVASFCPDSNDRICKCPVAALVVTYALLASRRIPVGVSSTGIERSKVLPSGEKKLIRFVPFSTIRISPLEFKVMSVGKNGGVPPRTKEAQPQKNTVANVFFNICLGVFIVCMFYIFKTDYILILWR